MPQERRLDRGTGDVLQDRQDFAEVVDQVLRSCAQIMDFFVPQVEQQTCEVPENLIQDLCVFRPLGQCKNPVDTMSSHFATHFSQCWVSFYSEVWQSKQFHSHAS